MALNKIIGANSFSLSFIIMRSMLNSTSTNMKNLILTLALVASANAATERETVAATILAEARGEGEAGMYAVACVIQKRAITRKLSAEKVCLQKMQFSCNNNGVQTSLLKTPQAEYALRLADSLAKLELSYAGNATHYHTKSVSPKWAKNQKPVKVIGNHIFYKL